MRSILSFLLLLCLLILDVSAFHHRRDYEEDPTGEDDEAGNIELISQKIMFISMVCFSLVLLIVVFSHYFYSTCVLIRRRSRRREAINQLNITLQQHHLTEPPNAGLDISLIAALPVFVVESKPQEDDQDHDFSFCAVCLNDLEEKQVAKLLPNCNHFFHVDCIDTWLGLHPTCPLCRAWVQPRLEPQHREGSTSSRAIEGPRPSLALPVSEPFEGTSEGGVVEEPKIDGLGLPLSSFQRVPSMERSTNQAYSHDDVDEDLERQ